MSIAAINEQLLRAIGVGIAIVGEDDLDFQFHNEKLTEWFGEPTDDEHCSLSFRTSTSICCVTILRLGALTRSS